MKQRSVHIQKENGVKNVRQIEVNKKWQGTSFE